MRVLFSLLSHYFSERVTPYYIIYSSQKMYAKPAEASCLRSLHIINSINLHLPTVRYDGSGNEMQLRPAIASWRNLYRKSGEKEQHDGVTCQFFLPANYFAILHSDNTGSHAALYRMIQIKESATCLLRSLPAGPAPAAACAVFPPLRFPRVLRAAVCQQSSLHCGLSP